MCDEYYEKLNIGKLLKKCDKCGKKYIKNYKLLHDFECKANRKIKTNLAKKSQNKRTQRIKVEENEESEEEQKSQLPLKKTKSKSKSKFVISDAISRKNRGLTQTLFLIEVIPTEDENEKKFAVMGTTGNIYDVTISTYLECTCPDFVHRGKRCKHIYFILIKVMKFDKNSKKLKFNEEDLQKLFINIPNITSNLIVDRSIKDKYDKFFHKHITTSEEIIVKIQAIDDICPICMEDLKDGNSLDYCKYSCGKSIHELCFSMWCKKNTASCVFCRQSWEKIEEKNELSQGNSGYINLISD